MKLGVDSLNSSSPTPTRSRSFARPLLVIVLVALLVRAFWLGFMYSEFDEGRISRLLPDSRRYLNTAYYLLGWPELNDYPSYDGGTVYQTGEGSLMWNGPGYAAFLAAGFRIFGSSDLPVLILQVLISAAGCALVALIARQLFKSNAVATLAGLICAFSLTSISLSCLVLTDTLFFFLHALGLWCMITAFRTNHTRWFVVAALWVILSTYVRAVNQLWPAAFVMLALILPRGFLGGPRPRVLVNASFAFALCMAGILIFCWRNYDRHGIFTFTTAGPMAARYYWTARTLASLDPDPQVNCRAVQQRMTAQNTARYGPQGASIAQYYRDDMQVFRSALREHPIPMAKRFLISAYHNTTRGSQYHPMQLPQFTRLWDTLRPITQTRAGQVVLVLAFLGAVSLLAGAGHRGAALILLLNYLYVTGISGMEFWQGSRICYPAQVSWAILVAVTLDRCVALGRRLASPLSAAGWPASLEVGDTNPPFE